MTIKELLIKCLSTDIHGAMKLRKEYPKELWFVFNTLVLHDNNYDYQLLYHTGTEQTHNTLIVRPLGSSIKETKGESFLSRREYRISKTIDSDTLNKLVDKIFIFGDAAV